MMGWYGNGGWGIGMMFMGLFWVAVVGSGIWAVARWSRRPQTPNDTTVESP